MSERVRGKVAFITGAARGQGRSHAVRLAREGADIVAVDRCADIDGLAYGLGSPADLADTVAAVEAVGRSIVAIQADVRDRAALTAAAAAGVARFGRLDIVVANAGISYVSSWDEVSDEMWQTTLDVNLTGTWNTVQATAPHVIAAGGGSIIVISSTAGLKALPFISAYTASKHGVTGLARSFAVELGHHNVRVNSVHPTGVDTPMGGGDAGAAAVAGLLERYPHFASAFGHALPIKITQPEDVSDAVLFLASDESRYVTGLALTVDAGLTQF